MKKKIQDMIQGKFQHGEPHLLLPEQNLEFPVIENEIYEGSFQLESSTDEPVRGIVTCQNPNISCLSTEFDAKKAVIRFTYYTEQLSEGDVDEGHFVITSSAGEYLLSFRARITKQYLQASIGRIKTLNDFANLCQLNWDEALKIFQSPHFPNIFHEQADFCSLLYRGITCRSNGSHEMEEFLIGCGKKKRSRFHIENTDRQFQVGRDAVNDALNISKTEWGFIDIRIHCDAPFIRFSKMRVQMYDFIGKHAEIPYQIVPRLMHGGKNYAVITLENCFQKQEIVVTAVQKREKLEKSIASRKNHLRFLLERKFLSFQNGDLDSKSWMEESLDILFRMKTLEPDNQWNNLFAAYIYLKNEKKDEAENELKNLPRNLRSQRSPLCAFYLYLTTFGEDAVYIRDVAVRTREIFLKYQSHPVLAWILLQIDEALLRNPERKYNMIKKFASEYSLSPVFYQEAAILLRENPQLLHKQDLFENRLLYWMTKRNMLNEELAFRILAFSQSKKQFEPNFFRVLGRCHKLLQDNGAVKSICVYLIKMNRYGEAYFPWFQRGIEQHLKIAGLYEAYMLSWSRANGSLPNEIIKYFAMNSSLPAKRKALLFSYVVRNRQRLSKDWDAYMVMVKNFAVKELEKGHMSEELAIIYEEVKRQCDREQWDVWKKEAESCYRLHTSGERIANVQVLQSEMKHKQRVPVYQDSAYIYLYRKPFVILYEDASGSVYAAKDSFRLRKMISGQHIYAPEPSQKIPMTSGEQKQQEQDLREQLELFAGSVKEMYGLIRRAENSGMDVLKYKEQLMIRMLFTGNFLDEHEAVFREISEDPEAVPILDAYVSQFSRNFMIEKGDLPDAARVYIGESLKKSHGLNSYCETAFLKAFTGQPESIWEDMAEKILKKYLLSGSYFDYYSELPARMLRKYLLMGVRVIQYCDVPGKSLYVQMKRQTYQAGTLASVISGKEPMVEALPGIYTLSVRLLAKDTLAYSILNRDGDYLYSGRMEQPACVQELDKTRYGKICALSGQAVDSKTQYAYAELNDLAETLFLPVEE